MSTDNEKNGGLVIDRPTLEKGIAILTSAGSAAFAAAPVTTVASAGAAGVVAIYEFGEYMRFKSIQANAEYTCGQHCIASVTSDGYMCNTGCTKTLFHDEA